MRLLPAKASRIGFRIFLAVLIGQAWPALAQEAAGSATATVQKTAFEMIWSVARTPPYVFFVLVACSILTVTLIIERFMYYRDATGNAEELIRKIKHAGSLAEALTAINDAPGVVAQVIRATIQASRNGCPPEQIEGVAQSAATREQISMEKFLPQLDSMVTLCPLLGLLGTTIGMIKSFSIVAAIGMSDPNKLAGGISEALINTATGLAVAIPALFAYNYFTGKKEAILMDTERSLAELMVILKSSTPR
ncbi:MAG TPA: MotA/TolQ/ExbB proton channel family protein [Verrucomicrobiae bacterium]|nr:MotA/TolQ/ExbB proton channel family protein [Verrucomicrobiae bacterium]